MHVTLQEFIRVIDRYEREARREPAFWAARDRLGNYLAYPIAPRQTGNTLRRFLGTWRSYRTKIAWARLARLWTPNLQNVARSLSGIHIADAGIHELQQACELYEHLIQVQGVGSTNASKMLALSLTDLCVMWDTRIRNDFRDGHASKLGQSGSQSGGVSPYLRFLARQKEIANGLVEQCMQMNSLDRDAAIVWLETLPLRAADSVVRRRKPLAKLLDQYHYKK